MDIIETTPTSARTAECTPVILRETDRVRLVFRPLLVRNDDRRKACIKGEFVYQRKSPRNEWVPTHSIPLSKIRQGEAFKLELHSAELLGLVETLGPLYRRQWEDGGVRFRRTRYVRMEEGIAQFLELSEAELRTFLNQHPDEALTVLHKIAGWLAYGTDGHVSKALFDLPQNRLPAVSSLLGLTALRDASEHWLANSDNSSENFWQKEISQRSFVVSHLFAHPVIIIGEKLFVGGKSFEGRGGSYPDFVIAAVATGAVSIVEVKTPQTSLLGEEYRTGVFPASRELSGAIAQILKYRRTLLSEFDHLFRDESDRIAPEPQCVVIAGHAERELTTRQQKESFEALRGQLANVRIVTFDELFDRVQTSAELLEAAAL